jgi:hypothetical protein
MLQFWSNKYNDDELAYCQQNKDAGDPGILNPEQ